MGALDLFADRPVRAYVRTTGYNEFLAIQEDILLRFSEIVEQAGTGFAFPSRTLYHARDGGMDAERQQAAEKQVREWASAQTLPFPDFAEAYHKKISDTLDYPPEGSPESDRGEAGQACTVGNSNRWTVLRLSALRPKKQSYGTSENDVRENP